MSKQTLTQHRLHELFSYDSKTGCLVRHSGRVMRGRERPDADYHRIWVDGHIYMAHRLIWLHAYGKWPNGHIDHINGRRDDNRLENLRDVSRSVNMQNRRGAQSNNQLGLLGVKRQLNRFKAYIRTEGKERYLGLAKTPEEAHAIYLQAKRELHEGNTL